METWRDPKQYDSKSREYADMFGISKHEKQYFPMGDRNYKSDDDPEGIIAHLVSKTRGKAKGSFSILISHGITYRVEVADDDGHLIASAYQKKDGNIYGWSEVIV